MKGKMTGAAGLAGAFVAGMVVATMLGWGLTTARAKTPAAGAQGQAQGQDVIVQKLINPTVTDEDIALLRKDLRALKMQVIGQNMSLSDPGGGEVLADLQPLRKGPARSEQSEVCAVEAVRGDVGNDERRRCVDLCAALAGGGRAGAGAALEVRAGGEPGVTGKEGRDVFSVGPAAEHDHRPAIVFADSVGACEGVGGKRYQISVIR
jgi:hypothetical protein